MSTNTATPAPGELFRSFGAVVVAVVLLGTAAVVGIFGAPPPAAPGPGGVLSPLCSGTATNLARPSFSPSAGPSAGSGPPNGVPPAFPLGFGAASNWTVGGAHCYAYPVSSVAAGFTIGQVGIEVKTFSCAPVHGILAILFTTPHGVPVGSEDLTSFGWGPSGTLPPHVGDYVVLVTLHPLVGDELVLQASGGSIAFVVAGSGPWDGCGF